MKDSANFIEKHIEKAILGLCGAFALTLLWFYVINTPNKLPYEGSAVGPRGLDERILESARSLQQRVRMIKPPEVVVPRYSAQLESAHRAGVIAASAGTPLPLPETFRRAAAFGAKIEVPGLEQTEGGTDIALVTPLRPSAPKVVTGRSVAVQRPLGLGSGAAPAPAAEAEKPKEFPWVTVAAYFDKKAQRDEMNKARYATYRTAVYVAGVDIQRQEVLATGEFSEWQDVPRSKASVNIEIPDPIFDDRTGAVINEDQIQLAYRQVKELEQAIMQPPFYPVDVGDEWEIPPLPGFEPKEPVVEKSRPRAEEREREAPPPRPIVRGIQPPPGGRGMRGIGGEGVIEGGAVRGAPSGTGFNQEAANRREARKQIRDDLKEAKKALGQKDYAAARDLASRVLNQEHANAGEKRTAQNIVTAVERAVERMARRESPGTGQDQQMPLVVHPENPNLVAVWVHDDSVSPGKTYRYRLRVNLWNRYWGQTKSLRDPLGARKTVLLGDWSPPSDPVTVTPSTYFFLNSPTFNRTANVDVYKWHEGEWIKERFEVQPGDVIGGVRNVRTEEYDDEARPVRVDMDFSTGAVVLDLRFDEPVDVRTPAGKQGEFTWRATPTLVMTYVDAADGQVKTRILAQDRHDPLRRKLEGEEY